VNISTPRPEGWGLPSTRAQAEGLDVHPEPRFFIPAFKGGASRCRMGETSQNRNSLIIVVIYDYDNRIKRIQ
jgi:hypothetical protein